MDLVRLGDNPFQMEQDSVHRDKDKHSVGLLFHRSENNSEFRVDVNWDDVEKLIIEFAAMGEPKALHLQAAKRLANGAFQAGWRPISN